jgi:hypothetical protein
MMRTGGHASHVFRDVTEDDFLGHKQFFQDTIRFHYEAIKNRGYDIYTPKRKKSALPCAILGMRCRACTSAHATALKHTLHAKPN